MFFSIFSTNLLLFTRGRKSRHTVVLVHRMSCAKFNNRQHVCDVRTCAFFMQNWWAKNTTKLTLSQNKISQAICVFFNLVFYSRVLFTRELSNLILRWLDNDCSWNCSTRPKKSSRPRGVRPRGKFGTKIIGRQQKPWSGNKKCSIDKDFHQFLTFFAPG